MNTTQSQLHPNKPPGEPPIPEGIRGWSWGAFWFNWIWAIFNKTWIGLLALIPVVNLIMMVVLGVKGREWAWQNKPWRSIDEFNRVQRKWSRASWIVIAAGLAVGFAAGYVEDHMARKAEWHVPTSNTSGTSDKESDISLDLPQDKTANVPVASDSPYPRPQLAFSPIEFLKALKDIGTDDHWKREITNYLSAPQAFWSECVALESSRARIQGGESEAQAQAFGLKSCQNTTQAYHQCLHNNKLDEAVMCLQRHINEMAESGG